MYNTHGMYIIYLHFGEEETIFWRNVIPFRHAISFCLGYNIADILADSGVHAQTQRKGTVLLGHTVLAEILHVKK